MASIQGLAGAGAASASYATSKIQAPAAPKPEVKETAQDERAEQLRGAQESAETQPANPNVGSRFSALA
jgi:hypothetical protein